MKSAILVALVVAPILAGCIGGAGVQGCWSPDDQSGANPYAILHTNFGDIGFLLHADKAPKSVENFVRLAEEDYYDATPFYRVYQGWIMQGGSPSANQTEARIVVGDSIPDETHPDLAFGDAGLLVLTNRGAEDSSGSQFFVTFGPYSTSRPFNIFGTLVTGASAIAGINYGAAVPVDTSGQPVVDVILIDVTVTCEDPSLRVHGNFISPSLWDVQSNVDTVMVWAHNGGDQATEVRWQVTNADGSPLPGDWFIQPRDDVTRLEPRGTQRDIGGPARYADWGYTYLRVQLPDDAEAGDYPIRLWFNDEDSQTAILRIRSAWPGVSDIGDTVSVQFGIRMWRDQSDVDQGSMTVQVGQGQAMLGLDAGLAGLAVEETLVLHLPPPYAYGYDLQPGDPLYRLNGQPLDVFVRRSA